MFSFYMAEVHIMCGGSLMAQLVKNVCNAGDTGDSSFVPGLGRSPGGGNGNPLIFLPGKFHRQRSPVGYSPWGYEESDMTEHTHTHPTAYGRVHTMCEHPSLSSHMSNQNSNCVTLSCLLA